LVGEEKEADRSDRTGRRQDSHLWLDANSPQVTTDSPKHTSFSLFLPKINIPTLQLGIP
jgi:hypothetical protein